MNWPFPPHPIPINQPTLVPLGHAVTAEVRQKVSAMPTERESTIEKYFVAQVKKLGGRTYKFTSPAHRNVADRVVCLPDGSLHAIVDVRLALVAIKDAKERKQ
jgi:hypothetical protein